MSNWYDDIDELVPVEKRLDKETGAPFAVRSAVGGATSEKDRLATIRQFYPDAVPFENGGFVFNDPVTGQPTVYNPEGLDVGDVFSVTPEIAEAAGGTIGGLMAAGATGPASPLSVPAGVGLGAAAGRELENILATQIGGRIDTRNLPKRLTDTAFTGMVNVAGEGASQAIGRAVDPAKEALMRAYTRLGVRPPAGAFSPTMKSMEEGVAASPGGTNIMEEARGQTVEQVGEAAEALSKTRLGGDAEISPRSAQQAGSVISEGARQAADRFKMQADKLYRGVYKKGFDQNTPTPAKNTMEYLGEQVSLFKTPQGRQAFDPETNKLLTALEAELEAGGGTVSFEFLRRIRTKMGNKLNEPVLVGDMDRGVLDQMYKRLSQDMDAVVAQAPKEAQDQYAKANRYYRMNRNNNIDFLNQIERQATDERVFKYVTSGMNDGGTQLRRLRNNLTPEQYDVVVGTVLSRLGKSKTAAQAAEGVFDDAGVFSPDVFLTNWNKMSPEAKKALFGGSRYKNLIDPLNDLVKVSASLKDIGRTRNFSNTARAMIYSGFGLGGFVAGDSIGASLAAGMAAGGTELASNYGRAKLLTSPRFVRWLANANKKVSSPASLKSHITRLTAMKFGDDFQELVDEFVAGLRSNIQQEETE